MASAAQRWRLGLEENLIALDPVSMRLLRFELPDTAGAQRTDRAAMEAQLWGERDLVSLRADLCDCHIAICSMEVLVAFSDNFDYQVCPQHSLDHCMPGQTCSPYQWFARA